MGWVCHLSGQGSICSLGRVLVLDRMALGASVSNSTGEDLAGGLGEAVPAHLESAAPSAVQLPGLALEACHSGQA